MTFKVDRFSLSRVCMLAVLLGPSAALAMDTVEAFGAGVKDVELYVGGEGLGRRGEAALRSAFQLGYGVTDRISAYVNGSATPALLDDRAAGSLRAGAYASLLDSEHLDLDLFLDYGRTDDVTGLAAGVEVNVDAGWFGVFATAWEDLEAPGVPDVLVGAVATVAEGHQLLVGCAPQGVALAVGYNVFLREGMELINEVGWEIPKDGAEGAFTVSTGVLLTLR